MNAIEETKKHEIVLTNKENLHITGIKKLESMNKEEFILDTVCGYLVVGGVNLEMASLDIDNGKIHIKGIVHKLEYSHKKEKTKEKSFLAKVFKWFQY